MFNNVVYQATTDGRAFQLIPLSLISVVRSSTSGLLVASDTDSTPLHHGNHCRSGVQRLESTTLLSVLVVTNMSKNYFSFHLWKVVDSNHRCSYAFRRRPMPFNPTSDLSVAFVQSANLP